MRDVDEDTPFVARLPKCAPRRKSFALYDVAGEVRKQFCGLDNFLTQGFWGQTVSGNWEVLELSGTYNFDLSFKLQGRRDGHRNLDRSRAADCL